MGICSPPKEGVDRPQTAPTPNQSKPKYNLQQRIAASKFKHRIQQFCQFFGSVTSEQARNWVTQTFAENYHSTTTMLSGAKSSRKSRQQLLALFDHGLQNGWIASVFKVTGVFDRKGTQEWISWIYRLQIPSQTDPNQYDQYLYSSISVFNMMTGLWERSEYTQMQL